MKSIAVLLFSLCFACTTLAQNLVVMYNMRPAVKYEKTYVDREAQKDWQSLMSGEYFRVAMCLTTSTISADEGLPFTIDRTGMITATSSKVQEICWAKLGDQGMDFLQVGDFLGVPQINANEAETDVRTFKAVPTFTQSVSAGLYVYFYLIAFDTREQTWAIPSGETELTPSYTINSAKELPTRVYAYTVIQCDKEEDRYMTYLTQGGLVDVGVYFSTGSMRKASRVNTLFCMTTGSLPSVTELTVGSQTITDQATIDAYLSPMIDEFIINETEMTLVASTENDLSPTISYVMQTRDSLSDSSDSGWIDIRTWLQDLEANSEEGNVEISLGGKKVLAKDLAPCYNRLRIGQGSSIPLPRVLGESTRFYRLKSE